MPQKNKIHFDISERKVLLRFFDSFFVLVALYFLGHVFDYHYFNVLSTNYLGAIVLVIYLNTFGLIFEMYNLQVASNQFLILRSTVITVSTTVLVYLLTPVLSPELPKQRVSIIIFYFTILFVLLFWRFFYVYKKVI